MSNFGRHRHWAKDPYWTEALERYVRARRTRQKITIDIERLESVIYRGDISPAYRLMEAMCSVKEQEGIEGYRGAPRLVLALLHLLSEAEGGVHPPDEATIARLEGASAAVPRAGVLDWAIDSPTAQAASAKPIEFNRENPARQFAGFCTLKETWNDRVVQSAAWPDGPLCSSPEQIINFFQGGCYTQGLAMVVSWGGMGRRSKDIYGDRNIETIRRIERTLKQAVDSIQTSQSIEESWNMLMGMEGLRWSAVIASKTLHFLCRSLGFEKNPPVAIDGAVIRRTLWPAFLNSLVPAQRPGDWEGNSYEAYCRYMTAIRTWANQRNWTTTKIEATIFDQAKSDSISF